LVFLIALLLAASALYGSDLALAVRAEADFDRVVLEAPPRLSDALACVQSQAAVLPVTAPGGLSLIHYRKGYCMLLAGILSHEASETRQAAGEFKQAIEAWPERAVSPVSPALELLAVIAELKAGPGSEQLTYLDARLVEVSGTAACLSGPVPVAECNSLLRTGYLWKGWIAQRQGRLAGADRILQAYPDSAWLPWVAGSRAVEARRYPEAAALFELAVRAWKAAEKYPPASVPALLGPDPDLAQALLQLGQAQYLSGKFAAAVDTFDEYLRRRPRGAWPIFLRGRALDALARSQSALADYELAGRVALAAADAPSASGDAHFYRGVWLFRRMEYNAAEEEFAAALSVGPAASLKSDALAWWRMAAVAGGACQSSTALLESSLASVSDFFPGDQARDLVRACLARRPDANGATVQQYGIRQ
jgi:tetratricopeptide (TPR) repeat protein